MTFSCAKAPCKSCPYRRDVPSGVWDQSEYDKLPAYDGEIIDQLNAGATGLFMCHQQDGRLCAGWVGCHGASNLLAARLSASKIYPTVWSYRTSVRLFASGAEAAAHGKRAIRRPGTKALRTIVRLAAAKTRRAGS
jgi:hypothetical protein